MNFDSIVQLDPPRPLTHPPYTLSLTHTPYTPSATRTPYPTYPSLQNPLWPRLNHACEPVRDAHVRAWAVAARVRAARERELVRERVRVCACARDRELVCIVVRVRTSYAKYQKSGAFTANLVGDFLARKIEQALDI